jgi:hypothetical protein
MTSGDLQTDHDNPDMKKALYDQVCSQHDGISEFRAKLLALLPIASGAGIFLLSPKGEIPSSALQHLVIVGLFGIGVTTGLFFYELRGIQKCNALIAAGRKLEKELSSSSEGAFGCKPKSSWGVSAQTAALIVYPAVAGAWAYLFARGIEATAASSWLSAHTIAGPIAVALLAGALWAILGAAVIFRPSTELNPSRDEIVRLNRESFKAEDSRSRQMLEPILADDFLIVRSRGNTQSKTQMLDGLESSARGQRVIKRELVEFYDPDTAAAMTLIEYSEERVVGLFWNTKLFVRKAGSWRCRTWQVMRISQ